MPTINVRSHEDSGESDYTIIFGEDREYLTVDKESTLFELVDNEGKISLLYKRDIPYLIKALQKAQEIWPEEK